MIVKNNTIEIFEPFELINGGVLPWIEISYETYGNLNENKDNVILVCHYFSGDKHAAGRYDQTDEEAGWWDSIIGPGKALDTERFYIISTDALSCVVNSHKVSSTSPRSINPSTGTPFGMEFPVITIQDMVKAQKLLMDKLEIDSIYAVLGPSMGGLQALSWAVLYPEMVSRCIPIAACDKLDSFSAFFPLRMGIQAIKSDHFFNNGQYYDKTEDEKPMQGLKNAINGLALIARGRDWGDKILGSRGFIEGKDPYNAIDNLYDFERNIIHGVAARASMYDPNSYIYISKANILFDLSNGFDDIDEAVNRTSCEFLFISEKNDIFVLPEAIKALHEKCLYNGKISKHITFDSPVGHLGSVSHANLFADELSEFLNRGV